MNNVEIEKKWNKRWEESGVNKFDKNDKKNKYYMLEMFSYPSAAKLHLGHWYNYGMSDSFARFKKMQGKNVFQPMGFDAFGLPAENYAIKTGIHPKDSTDKNIEIMEQQLSNMGAMFDWDSEVVTCHSDYYKWTQWLFLQLYHHGLAYRKEAPVNWCPSCQTVLANEQATDGICERCGSEIIHKKLTQWFFKITDYAEELLTGLDDLDWPEKTKLMQKHWIGKSEGGEVEFTLLDNTTFRTFTTRADTLFGVSYVVLAPEHPLVDKITTAEHKQAVEEYRITASKTTEIDRLSTSKEKTGVWTGAYCINPINNEKVEVWIGDYVLYSYGTGAVMGVPSHDARDYDFAVKYGLNIKRVIKSVDENTDDSLPYTEYGIMVNSGEFDGMTSEQGRKAVIEKLEKIGKGKSVVNYRLRDWLISRQRYWGAPIPMIHCPHCSIVPVPMQQLPVQLPYNVNFTPDGTSPLLKSEEFMNVKCPICGMDAKRDPDTLDTFVCSSWYFLRYTDSKNEKEAFCKDLVNEMLPVDKYVGGAEHACMHLLYARFITKALRDMGYLNFDEPFKSLVHQGMILGSDSQKMSKSKGNTVSPESLIEQYGSDVLRVYIGFAFKYIEGGPWNDDGIKSIAKWLERVERTVNKASKIDLNTKNDIINGKAEFELDYVRNNTIKEVTKDYEAFDFNTAVARMMELLNALNKYENEEKKDLQLYYNTVVDLVKMLAPLSPHQCEEFWEVLGKKFSIFQEKWCVCNENALVKPEIEIAVQINSKIRSRIIIGTDMSISDIEAQVRSDKDIIKLLEGKPIKKMIVVPSRLINIII
ncbi:MAG: leucine--tRNA ligase [Clostridia bacterium]